MVEGMGRIALICQLDYACVHVVGPGTHIESHLLVHGAAKQNKYVARMHGRRGRGEKGKKEPEPYRG